MCGAKKAIRISCQSPGPIEMPSALSKAFKRRRTRLPCKALKIAPHRDPVPMPLTVGCTGNEARLIRRIDRISGTLLLGDALDWVPQTIANPRALSNLSLPPAFHGTWLARNSDLRNLDLASTRPDWNPDSPAVNGLLPRAVLELRISRCRHTNSTQRQRNTQNAGQICTLRHFPTPFVIVLCD